MISTRYAVTMRLVLAAVMAVAVGIALVANVGHAEPPPAMEQRPVEKVITALKAEKGRRSDLAAVRFSAEVLGAKTVAAPVGSSLTTLGPWGDNTALLSAEAALGTCAPMSADQQKKASALRKEFGDELPPLLRAWTLAGEGNKDEAVKLFTGAIEALRIQGECPSEHPMYSHRRTSRLSTMLSCVRTIDPSRDTRELGKALDKANTCALNNHAVG